MASAMFCPCETRTSTCRNFATISSGLWCFLGILVLLDAKRHTSGRTTSKGEDQHVIGIVDRADHILFEAGWHAIGRNDIAGFKAPGTVLQRFGARCGYRSG